MPHDDAMAWAIASTATPQTAWNAAQDYGFDQVAGDVPHGDMSTWLYVGEAGLLYRAAVLRAAAGYLANLADTLEGL